MNLNLTLSNSKSFSRVKIVAPNLRMTADIVRPPSTWLIPEHEQDEYGHINIKIDYIRLFSFNGVIGKWMCFFGKALRPLKRIAFCSRWLESIYNR